MRELPRCVASPSASDGEDVEDPLSELLGGELSAEPSGGSGSLGTAAGRSSGEPLPLDVDIERLAGAVAAAGVLLPPALAGIGGASTAAGSRMASASSGSASGCEGAAAPRAVPAAGGAQDLQQGPATLARQRSLLPAEDIGCVASVTFSFMHQEGTCRGGGAICGALRVSCTAGGFEEVGKPPSRILSDPATAGTRTLPPPHVCRVAGGGRTPGCQGPHLWPRGGRRLRGSHTPRRARRPGR